jgi:hypothetical protein
LFVSLSPMLFELYIAAMGEAFDQTEYGFSISGKVISGLFLADDLILIAKTAKGLKLLLNLLKKHCDLVNMSVSQPKSQIMSPADETWELLDQMGNVSLTFKQVCQYKYLGIETYGSMHKTGIKKQQQSLQTARKYKFSCNTVSRMGPDQTELGLASWNVIAVPTILYGTENIPFTETTIKEMEKIQSQLAKLLLGLPICAANICAQTDLKMKFMKQRLYEKQLKYYWTILHLPANRWVHLALLEHMRGGWSSKYLQYIQRIREGVQ